MMVRLHVPQGAQALQPFVGRRRIERRDWPLRSMVLPAYRWIEFLSCIVALVYHARNESEHPELREVVDGAIQTDPLRRETHP